MSTSGPSPRPPEAAASPGAASGGASGAASGGTRYQRSATGMVGAMVVTVIVVVGFVAFRAAFRDNPTTTTPSVPYRVSLEQGRHEGLLQMYAPDQLPVGWRATSASYVGGKNPHWHLGLLRGRTDFVGIDESRSSLAAQVQDHVDKDTAPGADVPVRQTAWKTFSDSGGDHALGRTLPDKHGHTESVLVYGNLDQATLEDFAASLSTG